MLFRTARDHWSQLYIIVLALGLAAGFASPLSAQIIRGPGRQPLVQPKQVDVKGTFEGVVKGGILLLDDKNQRWQVAVPSGATVHVTGTASADFLRSGLRGLVVEFQAEIDNHGVAQAKVGELTVTMPGKEKTPGLFPPGGAGSGGGDFGGQGGDLGGNAGAAGKHPKHAPAAGGKGPVAGTYRIVGNLTVRNGKFSARTATPPSTSNWPTSRRSALTWPTSTLSAMGTRFRSRES